MTKTPGIADLAAGRDLAGLTAMRGLAAIGVFLFHIDVSLFDREMGTLLPKARRRPTASAPIRPKAASGDKTKNHREKA